jgi:molybdate transport system regulatory protein
MSDYPKASLRIVFGPDRRVGPGKILLLEGIARTGSISAAAREMDMSYRRAWLLINELNAIFAAPVIETATGGPGGGGANLTVLGKSLIENYRAIEADSTALAAKRLGNFVASIKLEKRA